MTITTVGSGALPTALEQNISEKWSKSSNNVYATGFNITAQGASTFNLPIAVSGTVSATLFPNGKTLNVAFYQNGTWVDVSTIKVGTSGV